MIYSVNCKRCGEPRVLVVENDELFVRFDANDPGRARFAGTRNRIDHHLQGLLISGDVSSPFSFDDAELLRIALTRAMEDMSGMILRPEGWVKP